VPVLYWSTVHVRQWSSCVKKHPTSFHWIPAILCGQMKTLIISEDCKKLHCQTYAVDQHTLFCNDDVVAIATMQVVLDQYQLSTYDK